MSVVGSFDSGVSLGIVVVLGVSLEIIVVLESCGNSFDSGVLLGIIVISKCFGEYCNCFAGKVMNNEVS